MTNVVPIGTELQRHAGLLRECADILKRDQDQFRALRTVNTELINALRLAATWIRFHNAEVANCVATIADNAEAEARLLSQ